MPAWNTLGGDDSGVTDSTFLFQVHVYEDEAPLSEAGTLSSFASSVDLASEDFTDTTEKTIDSKNTQVLDNRKSLGSSEDIVLPDGQDNIAIISTQSHTEMDQLSDNVFHNQNQPPGVTEDKQQLTEQYIKTESDAELSSITPPSMADSDITFELSHTEEDLDSGTNIDRGQIEPEIQETQVSQEIFEREGSISSETTASVMTAIHIQGKESKDNQPILKSSSESLRQISLQLSGLMLGSEGTGKQLKIYVGLK